MDYRPLYLKNTTNSAIVVTNLGLTIAPNDATVINWEDIDRVIDDGDLRSLISNGAVVVNNGSSDLSPLDAFSYIDPLSNLQANYFTSAQLNSGQLDTRYYNKSQVDSSFSNYYSKNQVDASFGLYYSKNQIDTTLGSYYTSSQSDLKFAPIVHNHDERYYTRTQLATSTQSQIDYGNLINLPSTFTPPISTATVLGGVKIGSNINVTADGIISVTFPASYVLPPATATILGGVKIGSGVNVDASGTISITPYVLPQATATVLGGVMIGSGVNIANGVISVTPYTLPVATSSVLGGVKQGANVTISGDGTISVATPYTLPVATSSVLGGVKIGSNVTVDASGTISIAAATTSVFGVVKVGSGLSVSSGVVSVSFGGTGSATTSARSDHTHTNGTGIGGPYYTQTQLQTAGQSSVNWSNITNKPTLGGNNWIQSVKAKYTGNAAPTGATIDSVTYVSGDRLIWSSGTGANQHVYQFDGTNWTDAYTPSLNDTVVIMKDADDLNQSIDLFNGTTWAKIADPSWQSHGNLTNLLNDDHPQYHNGSLAFTGNLDMGTHNIINIGLVDGIDISSHDHSTGNGAKIDHANLNNSGTNTHAQIDSHIADETLHFTASSISHSVLQNLSSDDHQQYIKVDGTRSFTGTISGITPTASAHLATKGYIDSNISNQYYYKTITGPAGFSAISATKNSDTLSLQTGNNILSIGSSNVSGVNTVTFTVNQGSISHSSISNLAADDHTQYLTLDRHSAITTNPHSTTLTQVISADSAASGLTVSDLMTLRGGGDASSLHNHDGRYFTQTQLGATTGSSGASRIGITPISGISSTNVQSALSELKSNITNGVSLQNAYNNGQVITLANIGLPVKIDSTSANCAPLELTNRTSAPTTNFTSGSIVVVNNVLYIYDGTRGKWLSPSKAFCFGKTGGTRGQQLKIADVNAVGTGLAITQKGTITSFAFHTTTTGTTTGQGYIYVNGVSQYPFTVNTNGSASSTSLNIDVSKNDVVTVIMSTSSPDLNNATCTIEYCWRL